MKAAVQGGQFWRGCCPGRCPGCCENRCASGCCPGCCPGCGGEVGQGCCAGCAQKKPFPSGVFASVFFYITFHVLIFMYSVQVLLVVDLFLLFLDRHFVSHSCQQTRKYRLSWKGAARCTWPPANAGLVKTYVFDASLRIRSVQTDSWQSGLATGFECWTVLQRQAWFPSTWCGACSAILDGQLMKFASEDIMTPVQSYARSMCGSVCFVSLLFIAFFVARPQERDRGPFYVPGQTWTTLGP